MKYAIKELCLRLPAPCGPSLLIRVLPMTDEAAPASSNVARPADAPPSRKPWKKPVVTVLPIEETETSYSAGSDGNGDGSHS